MEQTDKAGYAKMLFDMLLEKLTESGRTLSDLRAKQDGFIVSWRTMIYLRDKELVLRAKRLKEVEDYLNLKTTPVTTFLYKIDK